ncbi:MAG: hypothetical protein IFJ96_02720 [Acidobacteria bacterium]|nr:hypothetical protein [Candidatus Sulfomarinibacter sp. MAG AM2]
MNDTPDNTPEFEVAEGSGKPTPPLPPPPGEAPPPAPEPERAPLPAYEPVPGPPKSPPLAAFLSFLIPGLGHLYVWAYERAFMIWATIAVSIFMIINGFWGFSFLIAFIYFFSIFDAYREAQFFNMRADDEETPMPRADSHGRLMFGVFLAVTAAVVLADKLDLFDMDWLYDWWPVPVFLVGVYFIVAAIRDRMKAKTERTSGEEF